VTSDRLAVALASHQWASPQPTGVDRYGRELATALAARPDVEVTLCAPAERGTDLGWVPSGVVIRRVPGPRRLVAAGWWTLRRPRIDATVGPVDVVHVTLPLLPAPTRRPAVYTVHDLFPRQHPEWYRRRDRFGFGRALRVLEHAAAVIAVSPATAAALADVPWVDPSLVTVIGEGVPAAFFGPHDPVAAARICRAHGVEPGGFDLFVGQVSARKDLGTVVEALARTQQRRPLVLAGAPGDGAAAVREQAARLGVDGLLHWAGHVPDPELVALLAGARALVHPSVAEGFGLTPLEAMAAGTPAVVTDAVGDTVGDAALRCPPGDVDAWAAALDALDDGSLRADLARRGTEHAAGFRWEAVADQTVAVYRRALG
jgi:alpha-1,3-rhamnosyl/mannosyltransferase